MMKQRFSCLILLIFLLLGRLPAGAQGQIIWPTPEAEGLYNQARQYLSSGAFRPAIATYQQVIALVPGQMPLYRDLAQAYLLSGNYALADETLAGVIESDKADEYCFQIAAASKLAQKEEKKARRLLDRGIDRFPHSGLLYHQYGKLYEEARDEEEALQQWVAGIAADPGFRVNYYEAARTYMHTKKPVWAILYGEIFVNLERATPRSNETRKMLLAAYKRLYTTPAGDKVQAFGKSKTDKPVASFEEAVERTLMRLGPVVSDGITTENLIMLRTRFLMEWMDNYAAKYPFTLFTFQDNLLRRGQFDAYNQWLFGRAENMQQYDAWVKFNQDVMPVFERWQLAHPLVPTAGDHYNNGKIKGLFAQNPYKR